MGWNDLSISKLQQLHRWSLEMDDNFTPHIFNCCNYFSMLWLKLNHVCKRDPWSKINVCHLTFKPWSTTIVCVRYYIFTRVNKLRSVFKSVKTSSTILINCPWSSNCYLKQSLHYEPVRQKWFWKWMRNFVQHFIWHVITYPCQG